MGNVAAWILSKNKRFNEWMAFRLLGRLIYKKATRLHTDGFGDKKSALDRTRTCARRGLGNHRSIHLSYEGDTEKKFN